MPVTNYVWDEVNDTLLEETDESGNTIAEYTHEPGRYGPLISQHRDGQTRYYHYDGEGSTRVLTDESGNVTDTYAYTAFGEPVASTGTTTNPFGYKGAIGCYYDDELATVYDRARSYYAQIGRFTSSDSLGYTLSAGPYRVADESYPPGDKPGAFTVKRGECQKWDPAEKEGHDDCCCFSATVKYTPTALDKSNYREITMRAYAKQLTTKHYCLWNIDWDWHRDWAKDKQTAWPEAPVGAIWTDFSGEGPPEGVLFRACPGYCDYDAINQDWEMCAMGHRRPGGPAVAIACIEYGWTCKLKYERVRVPEELLYIGKTSCRACKITCSKSWRGALEDGGVEDQSGHLPVRHGPPTAPW